MLSLGLNFCIFLFVANGANNNNKISAATMQKFLQYASGMDNGLACNISSINPAVLLAGAAGTGAGAGAFDTYAIMQQLSTAATMMYGNAYAACKSLDLSSSQCFADCIMYNHPLTLFKNTSSPSFYPSFVQVMEWYATSGSPIGWYDVGNPDQCEYFGGSYCYTPMVTKGDDTSVTLPHGCCAPGSCTGDDAVKVVSNNAYCFKTFNATYTKMFGPTNEVIAICEIPPRNTTSFGFVMTVFLFSIFVFLVISASFLYEYKIKNDDDQSPKETNSKLLNIFCIQLIWANFTRKRPADKSDLNFLDGIRVFSMSWVVLGHSFMYFFINHGSNLMTLAPFFPGAPPSTQYKYLINKFSNIFIQYAFYSVDTFFWLSGLLGAFSIYRNLNKMGNLDKINQTWYKWIPTAYLARFLRIAPMMMMATLIQWKISDQLPGGPHTMSRSENEDACSENWWKILIMSANLWLTKTNGDAEACMGHLWYVQVDWQCYLFLPWLVWIFVRNKKHGIIAALVPFVICVIIRMYEGVYYHFGANFILPSAEVIHDGNEGNQSYFKMWTRMAPYFIGVTAMFVMIWVNEWYAKHKNGKFVLYKGTYFACLIVSLGMMCSLVMWPYADVKNAPEDRWGLGQNIAYYVLCRPAWGVALSLLTFSFRYLNGTSIIRQFLSFELYQSVGKLTYTMYLIHLLVLAWWSSDTVMPPYYNGWYIALLFLGIWMLTAMIALMLYVFVEAPLNNMVTAYLKSVNKFGCCSCFVKKGNHDFGHDVQLQENVMDYKQYESEKEMSQFNIVQVNSTVQ